MKWFSRLTSVHTSKITTPNIDMNSIKIGTKWFEVLGPMLKFKLPHLCCNKPSGPTVKSGGGLIAGIENI